MKKIVFTTLALLSIIFCYSQSGEVKVENPNAPTIDFDYMVYDYGRIEKNADGTCTFTFTNNGKEPLIIHSAKSTCGCTVPEKPEEPIPPGEKGSIKVKYDTKNKIGRINKVITIVSNAKTPTVRLKITGEVYIPAENVGPKADDNNAVPTAK